MPFSNSGGQKSLFECIFICIICMCLFGIPSMVLARREILHLGILAARNPSFRISGGQKSVIRDFWRPEIRHSRFLAARNLPFSNSGGQKTLFTCIICMCLCGIPSMVLARREILHLGILAATST